MSGNVHGILERLASAEPRCLRGGNWISAPVAELRPVRATRSPVEKAPNPISWTILPA